MIQSDIVELETWNHGLGRAVFGLLCEYLTDKAVYLTDRANEAFEWAVENRTGQMDFGGTNAEGFVLLSFSDEKDAVLFKTFWL